MEFHIDLKVSKMNMDQSTFVNQVTKPLEGSLRAFKYKEMTYEEYSRLSLEERRNWRLQKKKDREADMASILQQRKDIEARNSLQNKRLQLMKDKFAELEEDLQARKLQIENALGDKARNSFRTDTHASKGISYAIVFSNEVQLHNNFEYAEELHLLDSYSYEPLVHVIEQNEDMDEITTSTDMIIKEESVSKNFMFLNSDVPVPVMKNARFSKKKKKRYRAGKKKKKKLNKVRKLKIWKQKLIWDMNGKKSWIINTRMKKFDKTK